MQLPARTPIVAAVAVGALAIGGLVAGVALVDGDAEPTALAATPVSSAGGSTSTSTTTVRGSDDIADDVSGPCDEAEHAADPRCAPTAAPAPTNPAPPRADDAVLPAPAAGDVRSFAAGDAGVVMYRVDGARFTLLDATPAQGWAVQVEQAAGDELDLDFRRGTVRVQVDVEWEDGGVRERVRVRDDATDQRTETTVAPAPATTTPTTVDDHGGDVDRDDRVEAGDDRSGSDSGSGEDDGHDRDDDRSGSEDDHLDDD